MLLTYLLVVCSFGLVWALVVALENVVVVVACRNYSCCVRRASADSLVVHYVLGIVLVSMKGRVRKRKNLLCGASVGVFELVLLVHYFGVGGET